MSASPNVNTAITNAQTIIGARHTKTPRVTVPHRIILKSTGTFITTESGKTVWKTKGHAQAALRNDLDHIFRYDMKHTKLTYAEVKEATQEFIDTMIEFVPYTPNIA